MVKKRINVRWPLCLYDLLILAVVDLLLLVLYQGAENELSFLGALAQFGLTAVCVMSARYIGRIYGQIWRFGGIQCYIRLLLVDTCAFVVNFLIEKLVLEDICPSCDVNFTRLLSIACMNLLGALTIRMCYRYAYKCANTRTRQGRLYAFLLRTFTGLRISEKPESHKTKIAIFGAGRVGIALADDLLSNALSTHEPVCFVDIDPAKIAREVHGRPVLPETDSTVDILKEMGVEEIVVAIPKLDKQARDSLYNHYLKAGFSMKIYTFPTTESGEGKGQLREFEIEDLLFREPIHIHNEKTGAYFRNKVILITGGGGSIGSELCRQLAKMNPRQIIILDIYENGAYDVQQELRIAYGSGLNLRVEIASITNKKSMARVFEAYHPQIVINAAAHKHVPLMEHNCIEAIENNIFGAQNLVELCEEYRVERFMMVSTDKAVNPTNVMGATKRMCEMIVQCAAANGHVKYSTTRFGNVLGSAGSVIPLFKKQIANGGPVTITDKRIIRYFMTIPEASQLVLESGAMAKNGELFVLDMGVPVKIWELAENMIRLSGAKNIEIRETGLRPGEKLYEELLIKTEDLTKTDNSLIFIERDTPYTVAEISEKLAILRAACESDDDNRARQALHEVVPTFKTPEEVNATASRAAEMKQAAAV